ncbi:MAG TPA: hypothetical protein VFA85_13150 [Terriglobales bacterium]|nr:hypothetical protein [Terriglobales bacterium]
MIQGVLAAQRSQDPEFREKQASSVRAGETHRAKPATVKAPKSTAASSNDVSKIESSGIKAVGHPHTTARPATHVAAVPKAKAPANRNKPIKFAYHKAPATKPVSGTSQSPKPH